MRLGNPAPGLPARVLRVQRRDVPAHQLACQMPVFDTYEEAFEEAARRVRQAGIDVAIRKTKEVGGRRVYSVSYAARNDSDYALTEIVRPGDVGTTDPVYP